MSVLHSQHKPEPRDGFVIFIAGLAALEIGNFAALPALS